LAIQDRQVQEGDPHIVHPLVAKSVLNVVDVINYRILIIVVVIVVVVIIIIINNRLLEYVAVE
jgi:hypothetical protein